MASGGQKNSDSAAEVGATDEGAEQGGCRCPYIGPDLLVGGPVSHAIPVRDMGRDPSN